MKTRIILSTFILFLGLVLVVSSSPVADFTMSISGTNVYCTSTSTGTNASTEYKWEIYNDECIIGITEFDEDITSYIYTIENGGIYYIKLYTRYGNDVTSLTKSTGKISISKDKLDPEQYLSKSSCKDAGYHWYQGTCHECSEPYPWNVYDDP